MRDQVSRASLIAVLLLSAAPAPSQVPALSATPGLAPGASATSRPSNRAVRRSAGDRRSERALSSWWCTGSERVRRRSRSSGPRCQQQISGGALTWTPPLERCLDRGASYAWSVRVVDGEGAEGGPSFQVIRLFQIAGAAGMLEVEEAIEVLQRFLADRQAVVDPMAIHDATAATRQGDAQQPHRSPRCTPPATPLPPARRPVSRALRSAMRAAQGDASGNTAGIVGTSASPDGAGVVAGNLDGGFDLLLDGQSDGATDTRLSQSILDRPLRPPRSRSPSSTRAEGLSSSTSTVLRLVTTATDQDTLQDLFQHIDVPTGSDPVADSDSDVLRLLAGNGVTISGDATTDSVTISMTNVGLDADTVDGLDADSFLRSDQDDSMAGTLTLSPPSRGRADHQHRTHRPGHGQPEQRDPAPRPRLDRRQLRPPRGLLRRARLRDRPFMSVRPSLPAWRRMHTSTPAGSGSTSLAAAFLQEIQPTGDVTFSVANAAGNPIQWTKAMHIGPTGDLGLGTIPWQLAQVNVFGGTDQHGIAGAHELGRARRRALRDARRRWQGHRGPRRQRHHERQRHFRQERLEHRHRRRRPGDRSLGHQRRHERQEQHRHGYRCARSGRLLFRYQLWSLRSQQFAERLRRLRQESVQQLRRLLRGQHGA